MIEKNCEIEYTIFRRCLARKQRMIDDFYTTRIQKLYSTKSDIILLFGVPALWNACPMKCRAYFIGAKLIPLGSAKSKKEKPKTLRSL
jgi:hypothetical protein